MSEYPSFVDEEEVEQEVEHQPQERPRNEGMDLLRIVLSTLQSIWGAMCCAFCIVLQCIGTVGFLFSLMLGWFQRSFSGRFRFTGNDTPDGVNSEVNQKNRLDDRNIAQPCREYRTYLLRMNPFPPLNTEPQVG